MKQLLGNIIVAIFILVLFASGLLLVHSGAKSLLLNTTYQTTMGIPGEELGKIIGSGSNPKDSGRSVELSYTFFVKTKKYRGSDSTRFDPQKIIKDGKGRYRVKIYYSPLLPGYSNGISTDSTLLALFRLFLGMLLLFYSIQLFFLFIPGLRRRK